VTLECGDPFTDPGATAFDRPDGDITGSIVIGGDAVDTNSAGTYVITYDVQDSDGNAAPQQTRTVTVADTIPPVIALVGDNPLLLADGEPFVDPGAMATDNCDGDVSGAVAVNGASSVNPEVLGTYDVTYDAMDAAGNAAETVTRTVQVLPPAVYVAPDGDDDTGNGTLGMPWGTIAVAQSQVLPLASAESPATIELAPGVCEEAVEFRPYVHLVGSGTELTTIRPPANALSVGGTIVEGANGAGLADLSIAIPAGAPSAITLLRIFDVSMTVRDVVFNGRNQVFSTGADIQLAGSSDTVISRCLFERMESSIRCVESNANITRNRFDSINGDAVFISQPGKGASGITTPLLGDATDDEATGFNEFGDVDGDFVDSNDPTMTFAENNNWGNLIDPKQIAEKIKGVVDFQPFVGARLVHSADQDENFTVNLVERLRVIQLFNSAGYRCDDTREDGYAPGPGDDTCLPHAADYNPADFAINLSELLRVIQFFNAGAYSRCDGGEDGFCVGAE